jgi:hypothetical protein
MIARLRFIPRLIHYGPEAVWAILRSPSSHHHSWFSQLDEDLEWMAIQSPREEIVRNKDPETSLRKWATEMATSTPGKWKAAVNRTRARCCAYKKILYEWKQWEHHFLANNTCHADDTRQTPDIACPFCDRKFGHTASVLLHLYQAHGHAQSKVREVAQGSRCAACLTEYHTNRRLLLHFHNMPTCYNLARSWQEADGTTTSSTDTPPRVGHTPSANAIPPERLPSFRVPGPLTLERTEAEKNGNRACSGHKMSPSEQIARYLGTDTPASGAVDTEKDDNDTTATTNKQAQVATASHVTASDHGPTDDAEPPAKRLRCKQPTIRPATRPPQDMLVDTGTRTILVVGNAKQLIGLLTGQHSIHNATIVCWEGPIDARGKINVKETKDWTDRAREGLITAVAWYPPAYGKGKARNVVRSHDEPWGTNDNNIGDMCCVRAINLSTLIGTHMLNIMHDVGGIGVMVHDKPSDNGEAMARAIDRLLDSSNQHGNYWHQTGVPNIPVEASAHGAKVNTSSLAKCIKTAAEARRPRRVATQDDIAWAESFKNKDAHGPPATPPRPASIGLTPQD